MDGKKKYYDRMHAASEIDRRKNDMCNIYERVQRMQMDRFIEKIHEIKEDARYVGQMPRVRIRKASSMNKNGVKQSKTPLAMNQNYGSYDSSFSSAVYDASVAQINMRGSNSPPNII